jgi:archaellum component FlaF (FlaF/FlaG flagellin family)
MIPVLKKKSDRLESRGRKTKDQEWEDELRAELAAKNKHQQQRKLTKEEQVAVDGQKKKEAAIRARVQQVYDQINLGLDILGALISSSSSSDALTLQALGAILAMAKANAGLLVKDKLVDTYLAVGRTQQVDINGPLADAVCLATLRCNQVETLPARWLDEPLLDLMNRLLYKLRFQTESRALSPSAFAFCFPVLYQVIKQGGVACPKASELAMEQVAMALDIVGFHVSLAHLSGRQDIIDCLLYSIREYPAHSKAAKSSLVSLCTAMDGTTISSDEFKALFQGLLSDESVVRHAALQGLEVSLSIKAKAPKNQRLLIYIYVCVLSRSSI